MFLSPLSSPAANASSDAARGLSLSLSLDKPDIKEQSLPVGFSKAFLSFFSQ